MSAVASPEPQDSDHGELMDRVYRHQRRFYDFTRKYYLFGRDRLIGELNPAPDARIVEIGCGTARNLIKIAERYPEARLFGLDASAEMLRTAAAAVARQGIASRVHLVQGYAEHLSPQLCGETEPFDHAIFSYSLSMIPDWRAAIAAARGCLKPLGMLHVVDFGDLRGLGFARGLLRGWLGLFHVSPREELLSAIASSGAGELKMLPLRYAFLWHSPANAAPAASMPEQSACVGK